MFNHRASRVDYGTFFVLSLLLACTASPNVHGQSADVKRSTVGAAPINRQHCCASHITVGITLGVASRSLDNPEQLFHRCVSVKGSPKCIMLIDDRDCRRLFMEFYGRFPFAQQS
jgi:hypothetical protein